MLPQRLSTTGKRILRVLLPVVFCYVGLALCVVAAGLWDREGNADAALVPGNTVLPGGQPSPRLEARLSRALELYRAGKFPHIIVSGGTGREGYDEAVVMKQWLTTRGVPEGAVTTDSAGLTTWDSAVNTRRIADAQGFTSISVVTQYFHVPRTVLALEKCGFQEIRTAHARYAEWRDVYSTLREVAGIGSYFFRSKHP